MNIFSRWIKKGTKEEIQTMEEVLNTSVKTDRSTSILKDEAINVCRYEATGLIVNVAYQKGEELFHSSRVFVPGAETIIYVKKATYCSKMADGVITILNEKNKVAATVVLQPEERRCIIKDDKSREVIVAWETGGFTAYCDGRKVAEAKRVEDIKSLREQYEKSGYDLDCAYRMTISQEVSESMKMWLGAVLMM